MSTPILKRDLTAEATLENYVLYRDVGKTNIPDSRDDEQLTQPDSVPLALVRGGK